jgi:hypothetical protein
LEKRLAVLEKFINLTQKEKKRKRKRKNMATSNKPKPTYIKPIGSDTQASVKGIGKLSPKGNLTPKPTKKGK